MVKLIRKLQFTGNSTYIISLPKEWVKANGLSPGSPILVRPMNSVLLLMPYKEGEERLLRRATLYVGDNEAPESVNRKIVALYIMGYDEILVKREGGLAPGLRNSVREFTVRRLPGAEIIDEEASEIRIRVLLKSDENTLWDSIRRLGKVSHSLLHDVCKCMESEDLSSLPDIVKEDDMVDRVYFYSIRVVNLLAEGAIASANIRPVDLPIMRAAAKLLERIGDHSTYIAQNASQLAARRKLLRELSRLCYLSLDIFSRALKGFLAGDPFVIEEISPRLSELRSAEDELIRESSRELSPHEFASLKMMLESMRRIGEYSRDLGELSLNMNIEKVLSADREARSPLSP